MPYRLRRLEPLPTLVALSGIALMLFLGFWQLQRLEWKTSLIRQIEEGNRERPITLLQGHDFTALEFRKVSLDGRFIANKELQITPRYRGARLGYDLVQPFALARGGAVLVDRGWVPAERKEAATRSEALAPKGIVTVEGMIRGTGRHNRATPDNQPEKNLWFWYDIPAAQKMLGLTLLPTVIHQTNRLGEAELPIPNDETVSLRNDHLGYAVTWFLIAFSGLVIFLVYHLEKKEAP